MPCTRLRISGPPTRGSRCCGISCATAPNVKDLVGYGATANVETLAAPGLTNTTADARTGALIDTDNNSVDFTSGVPKATNSGFTARHGPVPLLARSPVRVNGAGQSEGEPTKSGRPTDTRVACGTWRRLMAPTVRAFTAQAGSISAQLSRLFFDILDPL